MKTFIPHQLKHIHFFTDSSNDHFANIQNEAELHPPNSYVSLVLSCAIFPSCNIYTNVRIHLHFAGIISLPGFKISVPLWRRISRESKFRWHGLSHCHRWIDSSHRRYGGESKGSRASLLYGHLVLLKMSTPTKIKLDLLGYKNQKVCEATETRPVQ